ncbi:hypothetical protein RchiOBHm_Chr7g0231511 [Rosa chinensis]|uniref:Uncharacterized protein n=1 Tax=Rosa chinensis TaxID=74649 RepID=A0A2P6PFR6_ROSCH|nr:hypothetical protein RchiOBHm_Chr7g0231511 [Rosa chinensis]
MGAVGDLGHRPVEVPCAPGIRTCKAEAAQAGGGSALGCVQVRRGDLREEAQESVVLQGRGTALGCCRGATGSGCCDGGEPRWVLQLWTGAGLLESVMQAAAGNGVDGREGWQPVGMGRLTGGGGGEVRAVWVEVEIRR